MTHTIDTDLRMCPLPAGYFWKVIFHSAPTHNGAVHLYVHKRGWFGSTQIESTCAVLGSNRKTAGQIAREIMEDSWALWRQVKDMPENKDLQKRQAAEVAKLLGPDVVVDVSGY